MNICFVSTFFPGVTLSTIQNIVKRGHHADYYMFAQQGKVHTETFTFDASVKGSDIKKTKKNNLIFNYLDRKVNISIVPYYLIKNRKYVIGYLAFYRNIAIIRKLIKEICSNNYDIIYIVVNEEHDAIFCELLKKRGIKNVIIAYHEVVENHIGVPKIKKVVQRTQTLGYPIIVHSDNVKQLLYEHTGNNKIYKIPFGPMETYTLYDNDYPMIKESYILYIGNIHPYKGLSFMYDALEKYGDNINYKVVVAGKGYDPVIEKMKLNQNYIIINKYLSDKEFSNLIKYAKCTICPYIAGSQSGIPSVAMLYGTPVIATRTAAFAEYIEDGVNGLLVDFGDEKQLACAIEQVIKSTENEYSRIPEKLKWDIIINNFEKICKSSDFS